MLNFKFISFLTLVCLSSLPSSAAATCEKILNNSKSELVDAPQIPGYQIHSRIIRELDDFFGPSWKNKTHDEVTAHLYAELTKWMKDNPGKSLSEAPFSRPQKIWNWYQSSIDLVNTLHEKIQKDELNPIDWVSVTTTEKEIVQYYGTPQLSLHRRVRIASVTKTVTALTIYQIYEKLGLALLKDPQHLALVLKNYGITVPPELSRLTLYDLVTHNGGLQKGTGINSWMDPAVHANGEFPSLAAILARVRQAGLGAYKTVGVEFSANYSNFGFDLLGLAVAYHADKTADPETAFQEYVIKNILAPLGMTESGFNIPENERNDQLVGYGAKNDTGARQAMPLILRPRGESASAGLFSTAADMAKLGQFFLKVVQDSSQSPNLLKRETLLEMFQLNNGNVGHFQGNMVMSPASGMLKIPRGQYAHQTKIFQTGSFLGSECVFSLDFFTGQATFTFLNSHSPALQQDIVKFIGGLNVMANPYNNTNFRDIEWTVDESQIGSSPKDNSQFKFKEAPSLTKQEFDFLKQISGDYFSPSFGKVTVSAKVYDSPKDQNYILYTLFSNFGALIPLPSTEANILQFRTFNREYHLDKNAATQNPYHSFTKGNGELIQIEIENGPNGKVSPKALIMGNTFRYRFLK